MATFGFGSQALQVDRLLVLAAKHAGDLLTDVRKDRLAV